MAGFGDYFNELNSFSISQRFKAPVFKKAEQLLTSEDALNSVIEFVAKGEVLFQQELEDAERSGRGVDPRVFSLYKIVLDAKFQLIEALKKDKAFNKYNYLFVAKEPSARVKS